MIALIDYGVGNLRSVYKALTAVGADVMLTSDRDQIRAARKVVLPGVGAFGDGMEGIRQRGLEVTVREVSHRGTPLLGICLGMQLLFDVSDELGEHKGFGFLTGRVERFSNPSLKIPQTGWNRIYPEQNSPLFRNFEPGSYAYFNHSYYCRPEQGGNVLASTEYGIRYASVTGRDNIYGVQFHPEKSQAVGLLILRNFVECC